MTGIVTDPGGRSVPRRQYPARGVRSDHPIAQAALCGVLQQVPGARRTEIRTVQIAEIQPRTHTDKSGQIEDQFFTRKAILTQRRDDRNGIQELAKNIDWNLFGGLRKLSAFYVAFVTPSETVIRVKILSVSVANKACTRGRKWKKLYWHWPPRWQSAGALATDGPSQR
jgi:hypothetical protein